MRTYPFPASFSSSRLCSSLAGDRRETKGRRESPRSPAVPERGERPEIPQSPRARRETHPSSSPRAAPPGNPGPQPRTWDCVESRVGEGGGGKRRLCRVGPPVRLLPPLRGTPAEKRGRRGRRSRGWPATSPAACPSRRAASRLPGGAVGSGSCHRRRRRHPRP